MKESVNLSWTTITLGTRIFLVKVFSNLQCMTDGSLQIAHYFLNDQALEIGVQGENDHLLIFKIYIKWTHRQIKWGFAAATQRCDMVNGTIVIKGQTKIHKKSMLRWSRMLAARFQSQKIWLKKKIWWRGQIWICFASICFAYRCAFL